MLVATPTHFLARSYRLTDDGVEVGWLHPSRVSMHRATLELGLDSYSLLRDGLLGPFVLKSGEEVAAAADKTSAFRNRFQVAVGGRILPYERTGFMGGTYNLRDEHGILGTVERRLFTRSIETDLPDEIPLLERCFLLWLAYMSWKRDTAASS